jgi:hypothetical protein
MGGSNGACLSGPYLLDGCCVSDPGSPKHEHPQDVDHGQHSLSIAHFTVVRPCPPAPCTPCTPCAAAGPKAP